MTQPVDVMKTRMMNAKPGEFKVQFEVMLLHGLSRSDILLSSADHNALFLVHRKDRATRVL